MGFFWVNFQCRLSYSGIHTSVWKILHTLTGMGSMLWWYKLPSMNSEVIKKIFLIQPHKNFSKNKLFKKQEEETFRQITFIIGNCNSFSNLFLFPFLSFLPLFLNNWHKHDWKDGRHSGSANNTPTPKTNKVLQAPSHPKLWSCWVRLSPANGAADSKDPCWPECSPGCWLPWRCHRKTRSRCPTACSGAVPAIVWATEGQQEFKLWNKSHTHTHTHTHACTYWLGNACGCMFWALYGKIRHIRNCHYYYCPK